MTNIPIVPLVLLGTLTLKLTDFFKYLSNYRDASSRNAAVTQFTAWGIGVGSIFLLSATDFANQVSYGGHALDTLNIFTRILLGVTGTSLLSTVYDFKKAIDNSDSAATPALIGPAISRVTRHGILRKTVLNPAPFDPTGGSVLAPGGTTTYGQGGDPGHVIAQGGSTPLQGTYAPGNVASYAPTAYPNLPAQPNAVAPGGVAVYQTGPLVPGHAESYAPTAQPQSPWSPPGGIGGTAGKYTLSAPTPLGADAPVDSTAVSESLTVEELVAALAQANADLAVFKAAKAASEIPHAV